ncbi:response regulator transcription factor [Roseospira marina]|uniref:Response regulator transcription factor n=2 Tax=Roseospira marina TaxID=140057 RepID=A0A5M6ICJ3_9PROT|nr:response regulator transcription factor [Roseospira marina]KAA5605348.1 response regulator transcription factor [Roseospira marina]MBB4314752.1 DNA-binding NarL/FixJ family response regulator [Roseospira marina]MBB5087741.1 DNA-binding NarL/FixJ family response regulator [Roseospira marina]
MNKARSVCVLLADDHALLRDGIRPFLTDLAEDVEILEAVDFDGALQMASDRVPDLLLLDLKMPGMAGVETVSAFRKACPDVPVVIITGQVVREDVLRAMELGASGYLPKAMSGASFVHALRLILSGQPYFSAHLLGPGGGEGEAAASSQQAGGRFADLTNREVQVLSLLVRGESNKEIGLHLGLTEITVKSHMRSIFKKIGAANRTQAVAMAIQQGVSG